MLTFLNPTDLFWSKVKGGVRRNCLTADDNFSDRFIDSIKRVAVEDCKNRIDHSYSFFDRCMALEPMF